MYQKITTMRYRHTGFENELITLIKNKKISTTRNKFQQWLMSDERSINTSNEVIVAADKISIMYEMSYENYDKFQSENITQKYKKEKRHTAASIASSMATKTTFCRQINDDKRKTCLHIYWRSQKKFCRQRNISTN